MDIEDIDTWYEDKKELLTEKYNKTLKKKEKKQRIPKDEKDADVVKKIRENLRLKLKAKYLVKMKKLHRRYDKKIKKKLNQNLKKHFFKHRITMWKNFILKSWYIKQAEKKRIKQDINEAKK